MANYTILIADDEEIERKAREIEWEKVIAVNVSAV